MGKSVSTTATRATASFAAKRSITRVTGFDLAPAVTSKEWGVTMVPSTEALARKAEGREKQKK
jgi:hypothetical protein